MVNQTESDHPSDALLLATIHGESVDDLAVIRTHTRACAMCATRQQRLAENDMMIGALLANLDVPPGTADQPRFMLRSHRGWVQRGLRIAGAAAMLAVAAAAVIVPASPLHRWIVGGTSRPPSPAAVAVSPPAAAAASGIAVPPTRSLVIVLRREQSLGAIEIIRTASGDVTFQSRGGNTAYQVASGQVSIDNQAPAEEYQIDIPASVKQLRVLVGTRVLLRWPEDSAQRASITQPDRIHIPLNTGAAHAQ